VPGLKPVRIVVHCSLWVYRLALYLVLAAGFGFAAIVLSLRYWILPNVENYRDDIAQAVTRASGQRVTIGSIKANWEGLRPQLELGDVQVFDRAGRPALALSRVDNVLAWRSLVYLELRFHTLHIYRPDLFVRRNAKGVLSVAGIELNETSADSGFSDWLLRQGEVRIHDARIVWQDDLRGAPPLELKQVEFRLDNSGSRHRFGLHAVPPADLAEPLDVRGDLRGDSVRDFAQWHGRLYLALGYADLAAWRAWVQYPVEFQRGAGALRLWLDFDAETLAQAIADVRLANVRTRLAPELQELDLSALNGRVSWKQLRGGFEVGTSRLDLVTTGGLSLPPADFSLRYFAATGEQPVHGEIKADALELEPLVALAEHLPIDKQLRERLVAYSPRGGVYDLALKWSGELPDPRQYSARARFVNLGVKTSPPMPGLVGMTGSVEASERGGSLALASQASRLELPRVFADALEFDTLSAQVSWSVGAERTEIRLGSVRFGNAHATGSVSGSYRVDGGPGVLDLTGTLNHADARQVARYVPLAVGNATREWLANALVAGRSSDVKFRVKGNLADFPFVDGKSGVFQVSAHATDGVLQYVDGWPRIENIVVDLNFRGKRMDINASQATIFGARLTKVHAAIADLQSADPMLEVNGEAEGPIPDFLRFIEESPVATMIEHFTENSRGQGRGKLQLKLAIPLVRHDETKVSGAFQFMSSQLTPGADLPPLEQVNGKLEFTESSLRAQNVTAAILGGPATINASTQRDGVVRVTVQGRATADALRRTLNVPMLVSVQGAADWRTTFTMRKRPADIVVESNLQGLAFELPAPLAKTAAESVPFRIERNMLGPQQDRVLLSYGNIVSMNLVRTREGPRFAIERGTVTFGGPAPAPERPGIAVSGTLAAFDLDQWRAALSAAKEDTRFDVASINVKLGTLDAFGRRFHDTAVNARDQGGAWVASVSGRELNGEVTWRAQGKGRLVARMKDLKIPAGNAGSAGAHPAVAADKSRVLEPPALDLVVENFQMRDMNLGKLELLAVPDGRDWRIEKLALSNPDATLTADGLWQAQLSQPRTQFNVKLEVHDIGKLFTRLGYPEGVRRGTAKLDGSVAWSGAPYEIDYPSLTGNLVLEANNGQFVKVDPGIGKLLGILSLQALPRRITLDFKDVFSDGFAFDEILATVKINKGVAATENFRMQGPPARIQMSGEVDLARESQKLRVRVTPAVGASVATLIGFANPLVGLGSFLASTIFDDPLGKLVSYQYDVTGTWSDPQVAKVTGTAAQAAEKQ